MVDLIEEHIRRSLRHIAQTESRVGAQRAIVTRLVAIRGDPGSVAIAKRVLHSLEDTLQVMRRHIDTERALLDTFRLRPVSVPSSRSRGLEHT